MGYDGENRAAPPGSCGLSSRWRSKDKDGGASHCDGEQMRRAGVRTIRPRRRGRALCLAALVALLFPASVALAQQTSAATGEQTGSATGLTLPRYASLKTDRVNLREGPSKDHPTKWVFQRAGLPVEITAEFETWRKVRDSEGAEGWVLHSLLSGKRTALVSPGKRDVPP